MDPFLEGEWWQEFHETLAGVMRAQLVPQLPERYVALLAKRYVLDRPALSVVDMEPPRSIYPDVHVIATPRVVSGNRGGQAALTPPTVEVAGPEPVPQLSVEIREVHDRRLVTLIEILSPANKRGDGAREFADRRVELLQTPVHLLEIDLLRGGSRIALSEPLPPAPYYVYLSRAERRPYTQVWAIGLRDPLPVVPVPLLTPDPAVAVDLQAALTDGFALAHYERLLDYTAPLPPPALSDADAAWVQATVAATRA
jgi:hypothetical protein